MQNEQNKKRISMIIPSSETGSGKWQRPLLCLQHSKQLQTYSEIKNNKNTSLFLRKHSKNGGLDSEIKNCLHYEDLKCIFYV